MAVTPNYNLIKPVVGADTDVWGDMLNGNFDIIDATMKSISNAAAAAQTPWRGNIDGGGFALTNVSKASATRVLVGAPTDDGSSALLVNGPVRLTAGTLIFPDGSVQSSAVAQTPWKSNIAAANFTLNSCGGIGIGFGNSAMASCGVFVYDGSIFDGFRQINASSNGWAGFSLQNDVGSGFAFRLSGSARVNPNVARLESSVDMAFVMGAVEKGRFSSMGLAVTGRATVSDSMGINTAAPDPAGSGASLQIYKNNGAGVGMLLQNGGAQSVYVDFRNSGSAQIYKMGLALAAAGEWGVYNETANRHVIRCLTNGSVIARNRFLIADDGQEFGALSVRGSFGFADAGVNITCVARFSGEANSAILFDTNGAIPSGGYRRGIYWSYDGADFGLYRFSGTASIADFYVSATGAIRMPNLPSSNPGAGTKQLWYDPADGNRIKFAA